jgi:hypothetical protein
MYYDEKHRKCEYNITTYSRATSRVKWLKGEKKVSRTISIFVLRVLMNKMWYENQRGKGT